MTEKEIILSSILNCPRSSLYSGDLSFNLKARKSLSRYLSLRSQGLPLQYILGEVEFFGLMLKVDKRVFIPRPETEILVETAGNKLKDKKGEFRLLDLGTGSGCIAISLAKFLPSASLTAVDISQEALRVAKRNARLHNVDSRIEFLQSDLFTGYLPAGRQASARVTGYDMIISNPPYIRSQDIEHLQKELQYEPRIALDGGVSGLDFYRRIIQDTPGFLKKDGLLLLEIGFSQCPKIKNLLQRSHNFEIIDIVRDYADIERVLVVKKHG